MKYLAFSAALHLFVVLLGTFWNSQEAVIKPYSSNRQQVTVEIVASTKTPMASKTAPKLLDRVPKAKRIKPDLDADILKKAVVEKKKDKPILSDGLIENAVAVDYTQELKHYLEKSKHYPRQAIKLKQTGVVEVRVKIGADGAFSEIHLSKASTFPLLDQAALKLLERLGKFKPLPSSIPPDSHFTIPIAYVMR